MRLENTLEPEIQIKRFLNRQRKSSNYRKQIRQPGAVVCSNDIMYSGQKFTVCDNSDRSLDRGIKTSGIKLAESNHVSGVTNTMEERIKFQKEDGDVGEAWCSTTD